MRDIRETAPESVAVLLSVIKDARFRVRVGGNSPRDPKLQRMLVDSGFFQHVHPDGPMPEPRRGVIKTKAHKKVAGAYAKELIDFATSTLHGQPSHRRGCYRVLVECMNNTRNHASSTATVREQWWLTVYCYDDGQRASFTFVDNGIGIIDSLNRRGLAARLGSLLGLRTNADLLREIVRGELPSRTGLPYRGKGLPAMRTALERKQISNLRILTNNVLANVEAGTYVTLRQSFSGTIIRWDIQ